MCESESGRVREPLAIASPRMGFLVATGTVRQRVRGGVIGSENVKGWNQCPVSNALSWPRGLKFGAVRVRALNHPRGSKLSIIRAFPLCAADRLHRPRFEGIWGSYVFFARNN